MDATKMKPFNIDKKLVYDGYKAVVAYCVVPGSPRCGIQPWLVPASGM